jgi:hypothetical protein
VVGSLRCDLPPARIDVRYCGQCSAGISPVRCFPMITSRHRARPHGAVQADGEGADQVASGVSTVTTCRKDCTTSTGGPISSGQRRPASQRRADRQSQGSGPREAPSYRRQGRRTISAATATRCPEYQAATGRAGPAWSLPSCRQPDRQPAPTADRVDPGWCRSDRDRHSCDHHRHRAPAGHCAGRRDLVALLIRVRSNQ